MRFPSLKLYVLHDSEQSLRQKSEKAKVEREKDIWALKFVKAGAAVKLKHVSFSNPHIRSQRPVETPGLVRPIKSLLTGHVCVFVSSATATLKYAVLAISLSLIRLLGGLEVRFENANVLRTHTETDHKSVWNFAVTQTLHQQIIFADRPGLLPLCYRLFPFSLAAFRELYPIPRKPAVFLHCVLRNFNVFGVSSSGFFRYARSNFRRRGLVSVCDGICVA